MIQKLKSWLEGNSRIVMIAVLFAGAILRWLGIGTHSFWYDEALSGLIAKLPVSQILSNAAATDHPPGFYLLLHYWLILGQSEATIRSLSALFSLAAIPIMYKLGLFLFDRPTGILAAFLMAIMPFQIYFAQETRMYGMVVFIAVITTWLFLQAVIKNRNWSIWLSYALVAVLGLYIHYFVAFLLIGLHLWLLINLRQHRTIFWRLITPDLIIALLFLPQLNQALVRTQAYFGGVAWQATPHILSPLTTVYYLLFAHRSPIWVFPIAIFIVLAILILTLWEGRKRPELGRQYEFLLWLSILTPIAIVIIISWLIQPIYLERSFAVTSPALMLLIARGTMAAPRRSPTPYLTALLSIPILITLIVNIFTPDPAKPPIREATQVVTNNFMARDVNLHLQDASFMPAVWYAPNLPYLLVDTPGAAWTVVSTHQLFGGDVVDWQLALEDADRLWLTVMPGFNDPQQTAIFEKIDSTYPRLKMWDWGSVQLYLYNIRDS